MNLVLIGYRCAGKTTVGSQVAVHLRRKFVDTDTLIEKQYGVIRDIVETRGWDYFRTLEKRIIKEISSQDNLVIAPGGGSVLDTDNMTALKRNGLIIWLKADSEAVYRRMMKDPRTALQRPSLTGKGALDELEEVMTSRAPLYEKAAEMHVETSSIDATRVVEGVLSILDGMKGRQ
jgi:shikimate kinase